MYLVITDYHLRWSNGLVILREIKSRFPACPVVMFTNTGNEERKGIERMGGSVEVRSRLGQGSQFSLCLQRRD